MGDLDDWEWLAHATLHRSLLLDALMGLFVQSFSIFII